MSSSIRARLLLLATGTFALGVDGYVISGLLPAVGRGLHVSASAAGQLVTVFAFVFAVAASVGGVATARLPRKPLLVSALGVFTAANVLAALAPSFAVMVLARVAAAVAAALFSPAASGVAASLAPAERRGRALAFVAGGITAATAVGVPLGTVLGALAGWRATFAAVAVLGGVACVGIWVAMPALPAPEPVALAERLRIVRRPGMTAALVLTGLWIAGAFTLYTYLATILDRVGHVHGAALSVWFLVFGAAAMAGNALGGRLTDRGLGGRALWLGPVAIAATAITFALLGAGGAGASVGAIVAAVALAVWGIGGWSFNPAQQHRVTTLAPDAAPIALSLNISVLYAAIALGGLAGGAALHLGGTTPLALTATAFELLAISLLIRSTGTPRTHPANDPQSPT